MPKFEETVRKIQEQQLLQLHTAFPGEVKSVKNGKASVSPLNMYKQAGEAGEKYPLLRNIPKLSSVSISKGDIVLCVCCERDISDALRGKTAVPTGRWHHSMTDSVIVGVLGSNGPTPPDPGDLKEHINAFPLNHPDGSVTDPKIGNRSYGPYTGTLTQVLAWIYDDMTTNTSDILALGNRLDTAEQNITNNNAGVISLETNLSFAQSDIRNLQVKTSNIETDLDEHIENTDIHVSQEDREKWDAGGSDVVSILKAVYPIDSYYTSAVNTSPADLFGFGTWQRVKGKFVVGADEEDADFDTAGNTGGEKTHTLTEEELSEHAHSSAPHDHPLAGTGAAASPNGAHHHTTTRSGYGTNINYYMVYVGGTKGNVEAKLTAGGAVAMPQNDVSNHGHSLTGNSQSTTPDDTGTAGENAPHNNLPPYEVAYIWRRTA